MDNIGLALHLLPKALFDTIYMVGLSATIALCIGLPLGVVLFSTEQGQFWEAPLLHKILATIVNIGRSFPFAILLVALIPFTRWVVGTSLGTTASVVPLSIAAIPYIARLTEGSMQGMGSHLIEAARVIGSTPMQIILKILLPETLPALIRNFTLTLVNLVGYSAMAGLVGGGGLGSVAIQYGYQRFNTFLMCATVILLILLVECIQWAGGKWTSTLLRNRGLS